MLIIPRETAKLSTSTMNRVRLRFGGLVLRMRVTLTFSYLLTQTVHQIAHRQTLLSASRPDFAYEDHKHGVYRVQEVPWTWHRWRI